jgi:phenylalanyl-tRNA synthetase beta chain
MAGLEVESIAPVAPPFAGVVVGEVLAVERHSNADKLSVCRVTTTGADKLQIVCGAKNVRAGIKVAVAKVGAQLPGGVEIKPARLRDVESQGMLCSARELGLGDDHQGIMELGSDAVLGRDLRQALDLDDKIIEVNATPNRGDCMSVLGIARDFAAAKLRRFLTHPVSAVPAKDVAPFPVSISAPDGCEKFVGRVIRGIRADAQSPPWLVERLRRVGHQSISPVVDVTNYVMLELGQPMHAYDLGKLAGSIDARWAKPKESITLLDGKEYALAPDMLVIADEKGAVGLAGVMGGERTAISAETRDVFLEVAHFVPAAVAGRARSLGLMTDATQRFERGVDPTLPERAMERATALLVAIAGGEPGATQVVTAVKARDARVAVRRARIGRLLGVTVPDSEVLEILQSISADVAATADGWQVKVPPHRFDLAIEADLIEEVARLRGYYTIAEIDQRAGRKAQTVTEKQADPDRLAHALADRGYREAITYSFVDPAVQRRLFPEETPLTLANPISAELSEMRVSLWPGLLLAVRENLRRQQPRVRLFELGRRYLQRPGGLQEIETFAGVICGRRWNEQWGADRTQADFYDLKGDLEALFALTDSAAEFSFEAASLSCLRPGRSARIQRNGASIGWVGELHPAHVHELDLTYAPYVFELDLKSAFSAKIPSYKEISKFPSIRRDISVVVDEKLALAELRENVSVSASGLLRDLRVFDVYRGPGIDLGRKSIALGLILQDSSRTLTDQDADAVVAAVAEKLRKELSATIRDQ